MAKYNVSKKEAREQGIARVKIGGSSGGSSGGNNYSNLASMLGGMETQTNKYANFASDVAKLPYQLKDEFNKRRSPELDAKIRESEQKVMGGAIEGLNKYKDIQDPFERRALAEEYQGSLATTYGNLLDEKDRRQGKFAEYIDKWSGLFGAEAARQKTMLDFTERKWQNYVTLADKNESKRRWEIELAEKRKTSGSGTTSKLYSAVESIADEVYSGRYNREEANKVLVQRYGKEAENLIYDYVPNEYEGSPDYFANKKTTDEPTVAETKFEQSQDASRYSQILKDNGYKDKEIVAEFKRRGWASYLKEIGLTE